MIDAKEAFTEISHQLRIELAVTKPNASEDFLLDWQPQEIRHLKMLEEDQLPAQLH